ncbi:MAG: hypothetical protein H0T51_06765 [Pirellulales bacterium]|nr:hypothetical protein [Pirellulales bacterium]
MGVSEYARKLVSVAVAALAASTATSADAQVIIGRGGGIGINVPGVGGVRLGVPGVYVRPYGMSRRVIVGPYGAPPSYGDPYGAEYPSRFNSRPPAPPSSAGRGPALMLPTEGELRAMGDDELLNALVGLTAQLDADLNRFDTGDTWQRYLRLPDDALPPPTADGRVDLGVNSLRDTLIRFERTVAKPEFVQISGLPSFAATQAALAEVVRRYGEQPQAPAESTPAVARRIPPPVPVPPETSSNEGSRRGILLRNRHAGRRGADAVVDQADAPSAKQPTAGAEELPIPPPALAAPKNAETDADTERSILAE